MIPAVMMKQEEYCSHGMIFDQYGRETPRPRFLSDNDAWYLSVPELRFQSGAIVTARIIVKVDEARASMTKG